MTSFHLSMAYPYGWYVQPPWPPVLLPRHRDLCHCAAEPQTEIHEL